MSLLSSVRNKMLDEPGTVQIIAPDIFRGNSNGKDTFFGPGGVDYHFSFSGHNSSLKAYESCPPLTAIINRQAQSFTNGKIWIMNRAGKAKGKESFSDAANKIRKLFSRPNPLQNGKEFEAQRRVYMKTFGFSILLPIIPSGYEKYGVSEATSMWNIPPYMVDIEETNKLWYQQDLKGAVKQIVLTYGGVRSYLDLDKIVLFKDFTPSMRSQIFPETRIKSLTMPINNIIGAYESINEQINYAGAQGLFSPGGDVSGPIPLRPEQKTELQNDFRRYGLRKGQWKYIFSPAMVTWQQVGRPIKDQMYLEIIKDSIMRICDSYNHPFKLFASDNAGGLGSNEAKIAERSLYDNAIIPDAESDYELFNYIFNTEELGIIIEKDFSHIHALQDDKETAGKGRLAMNNACRIEFFSNLITLNRWNELNGEDAIETITIKGQEIKDAGKKYYSELLELGLKFGNPAKLETIKIVITMAQETQPAQTDNNSKPKIDKATLEAKQATKDEQLKTGQTIKK